MANIVLRRNYLDNCTLGKWSLNGIHLVYTVERPWLSNQVGISCVSHGIYDLIFMKNHPKFGDCWYLENPDLGVTIMGPSTRTEIFVHVANFTHNVIGCIGPGLRLHPQRWGVADSTKAMNLLREKLGTKNHKLHII